jgi:hypothetical protein
MLRFKYEVIKKMDYRMNTSLADIEEFYDEVLSMYLLKFINPLPPLQSPDDINIAEEDSVQEGAI